MTQVAKKRRVPSGKLVVKDNKLINSRYNLSVSEVRLFLSMIAQIRRDDKDFKTYRIQISEFADALGTSSKNIYDRAKDTSKRLMEQVMVIEEEDGPLQVALISSAKYYEGKGYMDLRFDPSLKPYLLQLKEKFTAYDISNVLQLQSAYSIRIYELLKQYESIGERTFQLAELKEILGVANRYTRYNDFKRYVLLQAEKELRLYCDIHFEFEERKRGRKIAEIRFIIKGGKASSVQPAKLVESPIREQLERMGLKANQIDRIIGSTPLATIEKVVQYTQTRYREVMGTEDEIRNLPAYLIKVLEAETVNPEFVQDEQAAQEAKAQQQAHVQAQAAALQQQQALIEQIQEKYRAYRKSRYQKRAQKASEREWQAFEEHIRSNPFLAGKYIQDGKLQREAADIPFWLGSFLIDNEWPDTPENFISWVYEQEGYALEYEPRNGEAQYRITGKQNKLF
ncbi:MAG: replication initiation protein [Bacteroidota bacterium]